MTETEDTLVVAPTRDADRRWRPSRGLLTALVALVALVVVGLVLDETGVFGGGGTPAGNSIDNGIATSLATVTRRSLSSQTQVSATLGYADPGTIVVAPGTTPTSLQQAADQVTTAQNQLAGAQAALSADTQTLAQAKASLAAGRAKLAVDCAGDNAGASASSPAGSGGAGTGSSPCATDAQTLTTDAQAVTQAAAKVTLDDQSVSAAQSGLGSAQSSLGQAQSSASLAGQTSTYTELPAIGAIVGRGGTLYQISGEPVVLLYGPVSAWRAFTTGMSAGSDVAELNANLDALGYGQGLAGSSFTSATAAAIDAYQSARGESQTGELLLGSVVFEPGAVRVTTVTPTVGATVQGGPVLGITSLKREVTIELDAAQQSEVKVGDPVTITLPDNQTTPGRISYVGTVATTPSSSDQAGGGSGSPTIEVDVTPTDPAATGRLDQAPVNVSITTASVAHALVVPVNALLALASGGYAVEVVGAGGVHRLVAVNLGLFDDADGLVQISGAGLVAGQRVVVPGE